MWFSFQALFPLPDVLSDHSRPDVLPDYPRPDALPDYPLLDVLPDFLLKEPFPVVLLPNVPSAALLQKGSWMIHPQGYSYMGYSKKDYS